MKKLLLAVFTFGFLSISLNSSSQDYLITFAGTGAATTVSTVEVENLSTGKIITVNGGDILHLTSVVGISQFENKNSSSMRIYPNPMMDNSILALHPQEAGDAVITVYEMTGKSVAKIHTYLENGRQEFRLSGLRNGMYLINVTGNSFQYSGKILSGGQSGGNPGIEKVSNTNESNIEKISKKEFSETQGTFDMYYNDGERLKYKAISGIYSTVKTDIPAEDKTLTFNFIECTDGDNNNYPVVEIGSQIWMAENLKTTKNNNGELIGTTNPDTLDISGEIEPAYQWAYDGNESNVSTYGRLYTIRAAINACPIGWHLSTTHEWRVLTDYLGGEAVAGGKLKEIGLTHWNDPNIGATNKTGFTALPGGIRDIHGSFVNIGSNGRWWGHNNGEWGWFFPMGMQMSFDYRNTKDTSFSYQIPFGYSVRCLYDSLKTFPTTAEVIEITATTAISGGNINDDWGYPIIARGICWSSLHAPTVSDSLTYDGLGIGTFTSSLTGLQPNLTYFIRAYYVNIEDTIYGNLITFKTCNLLPSLSTTGIINVTQTSAISGGNIECVGASAITSRGVCWSTHENPTIADSKTIDGTEGGSFTSTITGTINTRYYVRAYATNSIGTSYGNEIMFATKGETGTVSDIDGNTYSTIEIGTQTWMVENLKTTKYNDGTAIALVTDGSVWAGLSTPGFCWANNDKATYKSTYGALYNWYTVNTGKLCPTGWHVPTDAEWKTLEMYLGMTQAAADANDWRGTDQGSQLKNTSGWNPGRNGTNNSGFSALPGGNRHSDGSFYNVGGDGFWWSSTEFDPDFAWTRLLYLYDGYVYRNGDLKLSGLSVRCLINGPLIPTTRNVTEITTTSAVSGGNIIEDYGNPITSRGVCWSTHENPTIADGIVTNSNKVDSFTCLITGLTINTKYFIRAFATNSFGTVYGNEITFATKGETGTVLDIDGNTYSTIQIGAQIWMTENLKTTKYNDGTAVPYVAGDAAWEALSTPGYCWLNNDATANKATYGALYNWYTVNTDKLCPTGWHVPTDAQWTVLTDYLGGEGVAGGKLKEAGFAHWADPNHDATNETGFSALPGSFRFNLLGDFGNIGYWGHWWSSTEGGTENALCRLMHYYDGYVYRSNSYGKGLGFSVRCLKDE